MKFCNLHDILRQSIGTLKPDTESSDKFFCTENQWRNVAGLANMGPLGGKKVPSSGAPGKRAYREQFVKIWPKNLNK